MYDSNLEKSPDRIEETDTSDLTIIDPTEFSKKTTTTDTNMTANSGKRRLDSDVSKRPKKRRDRTNKGISDEQREETVGSLFQLLKPLNPPETDPDILD